VEHEDREHPEVEETGDAAVSLTADTFDDFLKGNEVTLVNFYAPWCHWSRRLAPTWEHTARLLRNEPFHKTVRIAKVDCTDDGSHAICHKHHINAFPSVLVFRDGKTHTHEHYHGDRTADAFIEFVKGIRSAGVVGGSAEARRMHFEKEVNGDKHHEHQGPKGCLLTGYVMVKRVPGNLKFTAHSTQHSFDTSKVNTSHIIHHFFFGDTFQMQRALEAIETGVLPMEEVREEDRGREETRRKRGGNEEETSRGNTLCHPAALVESPLNLCVACCVVCEYARLYTVEVLRIQS
jgi:protein disulfide-isomerase-like protein